MAASVQAPRGPTVGGNLAKRAGDLLNQQIWCWGRDVLRAEGNWLLEVGFGRVETPADREKCSSVYTLELPAGRRVVLRGFGVFYGDDQRGGVFLPRYHFQPRYTSRAKLERPPWADSDLPPLKRPSESQRDDCASLTLGLIDWVRSYEETVSQRLGTEYRQTALDAWSKAKSPIVPAHELVDAWRDLGVAVGEDFSTLLKKR